jgi:hypothetical protein
LEVLVALLIFQTPALRILIQLPQFLRVGSHKIHVRLMRSRCLRSTLCLEILFGLYSRLCSAFGINLSLRHHGGDCGTRVRPNNSD